MLLRRLAVDVTPLRESRDLRLLITGNVVSGLGTQAALVALPFQIYIETRSAFLTGLLGAFEAVPLVVMTLLGGALADRHDRRRLLLADQVLIVAVAALLAVVTFVGFTPILLLYVLGGLLAAFGAVQNVLRSAIIPNLVAPDRVRAAIALNFGLFQLTYIVGPALGGLLIGALGVGAAYTADALSCLAMVSAAAAMSPQPPLGAGAEPGKVLRSIGEGLRFVRGNQALMGSFAMDLLAMTFGMPRALFPVLAVGFYGAGAEGTGLLYASVAAGGVLVALTTGWLAHVRRLGRLVALAVFVWGAAIALAGFAGSLWVAAALLAVAGGADSISAVCRSTINQTVTPDHLRGRMSSVFSVVVATGPRLGDVEAGAVAALGGVRFSVVSGGVACMAGVGLVLALFPALWRYDADAHLDRPGPGAEPAQATA
jgi:MFS family permease